MMRKLLIAFTTLAASSALAIPPLPPPPPPAPPPKLLIVISVDQLSADLFDEYRPIFTAGLARMARGTGFRNGYQGQATTKTCPGHSVILTGALPARTGIIDNEWFDQSVARSDKSVNCAEDERVPGSNSDNYTVSPVHLRMPVLGELLKKSSPKSLSVALAGKDRAAIMMGGHTPDQRWYWKGNRFTTDLKSARVPASVPATNAAVAREIATAQPPLEPPPVCAAKATPVAMPDGHTVGSGRFARAAGNRADFKASPELDAAVLALAASLIREMGLGSDEAPDVLAVGLSATDYIGHRYGPGGQEMCLQLLSLDRDLGDFFRLLDTSGVDYAVALTADHGGLDIPERMKAFDPNAARVDPGLASRAVAKVIGEKLGIEGRLLFGGSYGDIYLDHSLSAANRKRVLDAALAFYRAHPQVEAAFSAEQLRKLPIPSGRQDRWTLIERARASFYPGRSGDIFVMLRRDITPIASPGSSVASHGSPWDYDRRVPILLWRPGMPESPRDQPVGVVDLMPTLAAMLGVPVDRASIDGTCLLGVAGIACPPR
jgi:predicted AlkP superfamily pyrophosphatase or phosphodiesterase